MVKEDKDAMSREPCALSKNKRKELIVNSLWLKCGDRQ